VIKRRADLFLLFLALYVAFVNRSRGGNNGLRYRLEDAAAIEKEIKKEIRSCWIMDGMDFGDYVLLSLPVYISKLIS
jgi:hypothetical protein